MEPIKIVTRFLNGGTIKGTPKIFSPTSLLSILPRLIKQFQLAL
ncbi:MAG: hypothetical protein Q7V48_07425 [Deltaproteobacteria bacterium]|nr:hypothetical protein [Deltaproteobacteria bacterium]MDO9210563.1 hypothetical protein [Deltaproteobacteria bacterium]